MGIINRTLDVSEQKQGVELNQANTTTGVDYVIGMVERAMTITDAKGAFLGLSGTPTVQLRALRFVAGTGGSTFNIGGALTATAYGTSGYLSFSLPAVGSTLLNLQRGDVLLAVTGGANAATTATVVDLVLQNMSDIKPWY